MHEITGHTRVYAIIADPIHHVQTPQNLNALMRCHDRDGVMVPLHVASADLPTVLDGLRCIRSFDGFIATVPHKTAMVDLCDSVSRQAKLVGAVNCVRREPDGRLVGDIFDGAGFVEGLKREGIEPKGRSVLLLGAGGAANAIAFAMADAGIARLCIANRTRAKAEDLVSRLLGAFPDLRVELGAGDIGSHDIVINATSLGLSPDDPLPVDVTQLNAKQTVAEIIMQPRVTPLLAAAEAKGCRIQYGLPMLECQLVMMARFMGMLGQEQATGATA